MSLADLMIAGRRIGSNHAPYVIAEMSGNHNGDIARAFAIMEAAKAAGVNAVKFQTYTADTMTIDHDGPGFQIKSGPWTGRTLYELYQEASTPWEWHEALFAKARELEITAFSSPFDPTAVDFLERFDVPAYKVASFELVDIPLIQYIARTGKPMIMSTGMANQDEVSEAVNAARDSGCDQLAILHCISGYPTPVEESNLRRMGHLANSFDTVIGLSDHTLGVTASTAAIALGACIIEKHVTLARSDGGPDAAFSLEPDELRTLCENCREAWSSLGEISDERPASEGPSAIFRRSIYVVRDISKGEVLADENIRSIRPGFGLAPKHLPELIGRRAAKVIQRGTPLSWEHLA